MEESGFCLKRESQTALLGRVPLRWSQCSRRAQREGAGPPRSCPVCPSKHQYGQNQSQLSEMRSRSFSNVHCPGRCLLSGGKPNRWQSSGASEKREKTSEVNLCSNGDVLGGTRWFPGGGTFWPSESCVKHGIHTQQIQSKRDLVLFHTSLGIPKTFIDHRLIVLLSYTTLPWVYQVPS